MDLGNIDPNLWEKLLWAGGGYFAGVTTTALYAWAKDKRIPAKGPLWVLKFSPWRKRTLPPVH